MAQAWKFQLINFLTQNKVGFMSSNNLINSPTNSLGWTAFTTAITATTVSPTFGAGSVQQSYYLQQGKMLFVKFYFKGVVAGSSNGSGKYIFSIPSNFSMNTSIVSFNDNIYDLGWVSSFDPTSAARGIGGALAYDSTHYTIFIASSNAGIGDFVSDFWFQATEGPYYSATLEIPIN